MIDAESQTDLGLVLNLKAEISQPRAFVKSKLVQTEMEEVKAPLIKLKNAVTAISVIKKDDKTKQTRTGGKSLAVKSTTHMDKKHMSRFHSNNDSTQKMFEKHMIDQKKFKRKSIKYD